MVKSGFLKELLDGSADVTKAFDNKRSIIRNVKKILDELGITVNYRDDLPTEILDKGEIFQDEVQGTRDNMKLYEINFSEYNGTIVYLTDFAMGVVQTAPFPKNIGQQKFNTVWQGTMLGMMSKESGQEYKQQLTKSYIEAVFNNEAKANGARGRAVSDLPDDLMNSLLDGLKHGKWIGVEISSREELKRLNGVISDNRDYSLSKMSVQLHGVLEHIGEVTQYANNLRAAGLNK